MKLARRINSYRSIERRRILFISIIRTREMCDVSERRRISVYDIHAWNILLYYFYSFVFLPPRIYAVRFGKAGNICKFRRSFMLMDSLVILGADVKFNHTFDLLSKTILYALYILRLWFLHNFRDSQQSEIMSASGDVLMHSYFWL